MKAFNPLRHASAAFSNCVCGSNAKRFLSWYKQLLLERRRQGKESRDDDLDTSENGGANLVYTLHEKNQL